MYRQIMSFYTNKLLKRIVCFRRKNVRYETVSYESYVSYETVSYENYDNKYFRASDVRNKYFNFLSLHLVLLLPPYQNAGYATDEPLH